MFYIQFAGTFNFLAAVRNRHRTRMGRNEANRPYGLRCRNSRNLCDLGVSLYPVLRVTALLGISVSAELINPLLGPQNKSIIFNQITHFNCIEFDLNVIPKQFAKHFTCILRQLDNIYLQFETNSRRAVFQYVCDGGHVQF